MSKVHGENFVPGSTDYSQGDLSCDGILLDPKTVYACYGPVNAGAHATEAAMRVAVAKVKSDFEGALRNWPDMKEWVFVTNYLDSPLQITQAVDKLRPANAAIKLRTFGKAQFEKLILELPEADIQDLLGPDATEEDFLHLQPQEILTVVGDVMTQVGVRRDHDETPTEVPFGKLEFNLLEEIFKERILRGFPGAKMVAKLLRDHPDPMLHGEVASAFRAKYLELDSQGLDPGEIMDELYDFTMAGRKASTKREVAVWAILAHFFEKCTIFKDCPTAGSPLEDAA